LGQPITRAGIFTAGDAAIGTQLSVLAIHLRMSGQPIIESRREVILLRTSNVWMDFVKIMFSRATGGSPLRQEREGGSRKKESFPGAVVAISHYLEYHPFGSTNPT